MSPLHDAIRSHKTEMALRLIAAGADVDEVTTVRPSFFQHEHSL